MIRTKRTGKQIGFISNINITPFTDVCLVLLIIFMITAPTMIEKGLLVKLPSSSEANIELPRSVTVRVTRDQQYYVNNEKVAYANLQDKIAEIHAQTGAKLLVFRGDEAIPYQTFIQVVDLARQVGVDDIGLAARKIPGTHQPVTVVPGNTP
ncbi:MAG TPA: biopolymer transporter ExbD [Armatimonadota bacterium]|jgi:biopolymer transport protein ExbD